jgi:hypothetical protein
MSIAQTLLLHSAIHWPDVADAQLWPMAVDHAVFLHNHMRREDTSLSPHDLFTKLSGRQVHMGFSKRHASTVLLGLNSATGSITLQYHVVFDDWFSTVLSTTESLPDCSSGLIP